LVNQLTKGDLFQIADPDVSSNPAKQESEMNCQPGDLAVIVNSAFESNIGAFVRIKKKALDSKTPNDPIWVVNAAHSICFKQAGLTFRRKIALVQDSNLKPIGGSAVLKDLAVEAKFYMRTQMYDFYEVNEYGTITDPRGKYPEINAEAFSIDTRQIDNKDDLIYEVEYCQPLRWHFNDLAREKIEELIAQDEESQYAQKIKALLDNEDSWKYLLDIDFNLDAYKDLINEWLDSPIDWDQSDYFTCDDITPQAMAKSFFESIDVDTADYLGLVIVEGDHPGSTYFAAELRKGVDHANYAAERLGLDFRFKEIHS
jgi:hypothetical protein